MIRSPLLRELLRRARPLAAPGPARRWLDWARGLAGGRARVAGAPAGVPLVLAVLGRPAGVRAGEVRMERRLGLTLRLLTAARVDAPSRRSGSREPAAAPGLVRERVEALLAPAGLRVETFAPAPRPAVAPAAAPVAPAVSSGSAGPLPAARAGAALVLQLVERRRRVEELSVRRRAPATALAGPAAAAGPNGIDPLTGWALPVSAASAPLARRAPSMAPPETASGAPADAARGAARPPEDAAAALDIDRLADRVVRQIDRRIVAHHERMGRI
jgi:hypothetical protein